jgi:biopolymer transport protein ExbD
MKKTLLLLTTCLIGMMSQAQTEKMPTIAVANPNVVKLFLPRSSSGQSIPQKTINVSITKDLEYYVEKKKVNASDLFQNIEVYQKASPDLTIILYADRTIAIENVIDLTDIANKLKIKLVLATETKK